MRVRPSARPPASEPAAGQPAALLTALSPIPPRQSATMPARRACARLAPGLGNCHSLARCHQRARPPVAAAGRRVRGRCTSAGRPAPRCADRRHREGQGELEESGGASGLGLMCTSAAAVKSSACVRAH